MKLVRIELRSREAEPPSVAAFSGPSAKDLAHAFLGGLPRDDAGYQSWTLTATLEDGQEWKTGFWLNPLVPPPSIREQLKRSCYLERTNGDSWDIRQAEAFETSLDA